MDRTVIRKSMRSDKAVSSYTGRSEGETFCRKVTKKDRFAGGRLQTCATKADSKKKLERQKEEEEEEEEDTFRYVLKIYTYCFLQLYRPSLC
jgi:hypothetical protein